MFTFFQIQMDPVTTTSRTIIPSCFFFFFFYLPILCDYLTFTVGTGGFCLCILKRTISFYSLKKKEGIRFSDAKIFLNGAVTQKPNTAL